MIRKAIDSFLNKILFSSQPKLMLWSALIAVSFLMASCAVSSVSMDILQPAEINVPQHVQKVGVVNRSLPAKNELFMNIIEGFFSGESIMADREGSVHCIRGLGSQLNNNPRFSAIVLETMDLRGTGTRQFPAYLDWNKVKAICAQYNVDALVILETFDSNVAIRESNRDRTRKEDGRTIKYKEFIADLRINVNSGWRIYDPKTQTIIDESVFADEKGWEGIGVNPEQAKGKLPPKRGAINEAGFFSGEMYGFRISPSWIRASRTYFVKTKGFDAFKKAKTMVRNNDWESAMKIWQSLAQNTDPKVARRACYNMAVACEVKGKLVVAVQWAEKAEKLGEKRARSYKQVLLRRIQDNKRLDKQMGNQ